MTMAESSVTAEYIDFLFKHGRVSHVVSPPPGSTVSTLALTQRCLASGIAFPVPLPDGSVAVKVDGDIPTALAALDLEIEKVSETADGEHGSKEATAPQPPDDDRSVEQVPEAEDLDDVVGTLFDTADVPPAEHAEIMSAEGMLENDTMPEPVFDEGTDEADTSGSAVHPVFIRSTDVHSGVADTVPDEDEIADWRSPDVQDAEAALSESSAEHSDVAGFETASSVDTDPDIASADSEARVDRMERIVAMLEELEARILGVEESQAGILQSIESFGNKLEDVASRPAPRPDAAEFNRGIARMSTALAQSLRRIDTLLEAQKAGTGQGPAEVAEALSTGLSALARAVQASRETPQGSASELALISSMQETMSHQLAKLLETGQSHREAMMEEFLLDVRHATAELVAEQARASQAG